jgi:hypothetical protein
VTTATIVPMPTVPITTSATSAATWACRVCMGAASTASRTCPWCTIGTSSLTVPPGSSDPNVSSRPLACTTSRPPVGTASSTFDRSSWCPLASSSSRVVAICWALAARSSLVTLSTTWKAV